MILKLPKLERLFSFLFLSDQYQLHVKMKRLICILLTFLFVYTQTRLHASNLGQTDEHKEIYRFSEQQHSLMLQEQILNLDEKLQELHPQFLKSFILIYHGTNNSNIFKQRVGIAKGAYFLYIAKMYLYGYLDNPHHQQLQQYKTDAIYLAAYFYLKIASEQYSNPQAYYWLGLLQQFKFVPDKLIEHHLTQVNRTKDEEIIYKHLKTSHLNNGEHNLFMSAAFGFDPAALVLGHMNREPFGTSQNCTTALAYYLAVLKRNLFEPYNPKLIIDVSYSLEDELFSRKPLVKEEQRNDHQFVMDTGYFDEETISATLEQANRYYTGSKGVMRDLKKALQLFEILSDQGNSEGKIMAGLMYFRGEGTVRDIRKAKTFFEQTQKDDVSQYMLLAMDYFQMFFPKTKERALKTMKNKLDKKVKLSHLMNYLIGSAALKGEIKQVNHDDAIQMIDKSASEGNPSSRILMAILFSDGVKGLKYGCQQATKYLSEDAIYHPFFSKRVNTAEVALKRGMLPFSFFKYVQLVFNGYQTAFVNSLYLLQLIKDKVYQEKVLRVTPFSWKPSRLLTSDIYVKLRELKLIPDVQSYLLRSFTPIGTKPFTIKDLQRLLTTTTASVQELIVYMQRKIVKRGVIFEKRGILKYFEYKLALQEGSSPQEIQSILSTLASGDSSKLYVLEARYLLGQLYHSNALKNKETLTQQQHKRIMGQYNRAVKSQILGELIFQIQQYRLTGMLDFNLAQSGIGQDLMTYIFILAIIAFVFYYLRSKRFDQFHKIELEKQMRRAQEEQQEQQKEEPPQEEKLKEEEADPNQPIIVDDPPPSALRQPQGIRIGSSSEELSN